MKPGDTKNTDPGRDEDLQQIEQHYRSLGNDEPPAMLDQAILNKARLSVEPQVTRPWSFGWMHATATAAVLVIGLTLVLQQRGEVPTAPTELDLYEQDRGVLQQNIPAARNAESRNSNSRLQEKRAPAADAPGKDLGSSEAAEADYRSDDDSFADEESLEASAMEAEQAAGNELRKSEQSRRERSLKSVQPRLEEPEKSDPPESGHGAEDKAGLQIADEPPAKARQAVAVQDAISAAAPAVSTPEPEESGSETENADEESFSVSGQAIPAAADWLARIIEMKQSGTGSAWMEELEAFVAYYPDYPLPPELEGQAAVEDRDGDDG